MAVTIDSAANAASDLFASLNAARDKPDAAGGDQQSRFLKLLTTQLRNQDPLNPMDNAQMTSQLAQISTVDGIERLNTTLQSLMGNATQSQVMQAAALVGHGVLVPGSGLTLGGGNAIGGIELDAPADRTTVTIKDAAGLTVKTIELGGLDPGTHAFTWDGTADSGAKAADGAYTVTLAATRGEDKVTGHTLTFGVVSGVASTGQGALLNVGTGSYKLADVREIL